MKEVFAEAEQKMKQAVEHFHDDLKRLRTGRASVTMLDHVMVDYYGTPTPIKNVATVTVADASMLTAQPWDPRQIAAIEKALLKSDLGINPQNDGKVIRIPVPQLTEERRKELVKKAHDLAEHARTAVRQARREANDKLKKLERDHAIGQDDERRGHDDVQKIHDRHIEEIAKALEHKEKDILTV
jgi:ribosome recycling factor